MPPSQHPAGTGHLANPAAAAHGATSEPVEQWSYADLTDSNWASRVPDTAMQTSAAMSGT